jgi:hypothetical protein
MKRFKKAAGGVALSRLLRHKQKSVWYRRRAPAKGWSLARWGAGFFLGVKRWSYMGLGFLLARKLYQALTAPQQPAQSPAQSS